MVKMRRQERQINDSETLEILDKGIYGVLASFGIEDYPYAVPLNYVYSMNKIYLHSAQEGHKLDNIYKNERVCFCIVGDHEVLADNFSIRYESVIVFGRAIIVDDPKEKREALQLLLEKYSSEYLDKGKKYVESAADKAKLIRIEIDHLTGKARR